MARTTLKPLMALWAITVAVAAVVLTTSPASAQPAAAVNAVKTPAPVACQAADLSIGVPAAITGDPDEGMGKRAWNIVFRNISAASCSVHGWPRITVRTAAGKAVATTVSDVTYSNLTVVPDA